MTGLEQEFVRRAGGRLEIGAYLREVFRESGKLGSIYDSNVTGFDPFPYAPEQRTNDQCWRASSRRLPPRWWISLRAWSAGKPTRATTRSAMK